MRINVVGYDDEAKIDPFYPLAISKSSNSEHSVVNVLLIENNDTTHFVLIKSLNALLRKANTRNMKYFCERFVNVVFIRRSYNRV